MFPSTRKSKRSHGCFDQQIHCKRWVDDCRVQRTDCASIPALRIHPNTPPSHWQRCTADAIPRQLNVTRRPFVDGCRCAMSRSPSRGGSLMGRNQWQSAEVSGVWREERKDWRREERSEFCPPKTVLPNFSAHRASLLSHKDVLESSGYELSKTSLTEPRERELAEIDLAW